MNPTYSFNRSGLSLIAVILLLAFLGVAAAVTTSLLGTGTIGNIHLAESVRAQALAHAGVEWYREQLQNDVNWANDVNQTRAFDTGQFTISLTSAAVTKVVFTSTGQITNAEGLAIKRRMSATALKLPPAFLFALFEGTDPLLEFDFLNGSVVTGDLWLQGSDVDAASSVNGTIFVPNAALVTNCTGTCAAKTVAAPLPTMPAITATPYTTLMTGYDAIIATANGSPNRTQNTNLVLTGNTILCNNFTTSGNITITGNGTIATFVDLDLHATGNAQTLTITPSGGDIRFLAARNLNVGDAAGGTPNTVTINKEALPGTGICRFYSQAATGTAQRVNIAGTGTNTVLHGVHAYARRRITVDIATVDQNSTLFIDRASSAANNQIDINNASVTGSVLSTGQNTVNLRVRNGSTVTGLVYSYDSGGTGQLELLDCVITGSVVANRYVSSDIRNTAITYDPTAWPDPVPEGFQGFVIRKPNSWDGV